MKSLVRKCKSILITCLAVGTLQSMYATTVQAQEINNIDANSAIVVEQHSGKILYEYHSTEVFGIASMSKMITQYLVYEAIEKGELTWDTEVVISDRVMETSTNYELSNVPLRSTETYTVKELYEAVSIYSANAATIALAEHMAGTEDAWVEIMQAKLQEWGIHDAVLINASGLPNQYGLSNKKSDLPDDAENSMSAQSVAIIAQRIVQDYPGILEYASIPKKTFQPGTVDETEMTNFNYLLPGQLFGREGVTGLKTGTSDTSGASITVTASQNGLSVISVVMGSSETLTRYEVQNQLLDYVFSTYEMLPVATQGNPVQSIQSVPVVDGEEEIVALNYGEDISVVVPKGTALSQIEMTFQPNSELVNEHQELKAPIQSGQIVGELHIKTPDNQLGYLTNQEEPTIDTTAAFEIKEANFFVKIYRAIRDFFNGK